MGAVAVDCAEDAVPVSGRGEHHDAEVAAVAGQRAQLGVRVTVWGVAPHDASA